MNPTSDYRYNAATNGSGSRLLEAQQRAILVEWLNSVLPNLSLPLNASDEDLRECLIDGAVLCQMMNRIRPGSMDEAGGSDQNLKRFLEALDDMGIPRFEISDLEKGSMKTVVDCLLTLRARSMLRAGVDKLYIRSLSVKSDSPRSDGSSHGRFSPLAGEERQKFLTYQRSFNCPLMPEQSAAATYHAGHRFHEVFQLRQGRYADLSEAKVSEMMKSNSLDSAPTQSLMSIINGILDETVERNSGEIPHHVACLLRKVVQEIERRILTQAEHLRTQNNMFRSREEKYQSRIKVLEALSARLGEESQILLEKTQAEARKKFEEEDLVTLTKEKDQNRLEISALKQELEETKKMYEARLLQMETEAKSAKIEYDKRVSELESLLAHSTDKVKHLEAFSESKNQQWNNREHVYRNLMDFQFQALQELRLSSEFIKQEVLKEELRNSEEFNGLGMKLRSLADATENYHNLLLENRQLLNEIQDLKGSIRVYCRIRPFLPGQNQKCTIVARIDDNGEMIVANPSKCGKDGNRSFKFNKVYDPAATQAEVFSDIRPLVQSVLDGYNVCIFAYGQTGSGKTYTMTGPSGASKENLGVNYRALNELFDISLRRRSSIVYDIGVQMIEIYNENVRDLLSGESQSKKLGVLLHSQPEGLAVPDATIRPVRSSTDVMELMAIGLRNRAVSATAMNERSSRSHSIITIHVRGKDLKTGDSLHGNLHLVDLAGSERVDRSEVTGDRLREAQHINKSLAALGDVIFALAQKSPHVPYRNSKLTQVLQSSLGGQAKTLMFVQLNPDAESYTESLSTLKFAERVSGVELGAARSSKEGRDVKQVTEQLASLRDTIARKDEEIDRLLSQRDQRSVPSGINGEKQGIALLRNGYSSPCRDSMGTTHRTQKLSTIKSLGHLEKTDIEDAISSEYSEHSMDGINAQNEVLHESHTTGGDRAQNSPMDFKSPSSDYASSEQSPSAVVYRDTKQIDSRRKPKSVSTSSRTLQRSKTALTFGSKDSPNPKVSPSIKRTTTGVKPLRRWQ